MSFQAEVMNAHAYPPKHLCVFVSICLFFIISSPSDRGLSERREWLWLEIWLVWMFFILHQLQLATFLSWNIVIFPSMQINLKDNNIETAGGSSDPRPRVPLFATWSGLSNIRQGTKQLSILHLEGKRAPLVIIRFPTKVVPCPQRSLLMSLAEPEGPLQFQSKSANHISNWTCDFVSGKLFISQRIKCFMQPHQPTDCSIEWRGKQSQRYPLQDWVLDFINTGYITERLQDRRLRRQYLFSFCFKTRVIVLMPLIEQTI